ncbi:MAG: hypothetical protein ACXQS9_00625 [Methermicoccaceae archaeon]
MDIYTLLAASWALTATIVAWLYHRLSLSEAKSILALIQHARDELSEGGEAITPEEALVVLDALLDALGEGAGR